MGRTSSYTTKIFIHQSLSPPALPHIRTRPAQIFLPIFDSSPSCILRYAARSLALGVSFSVYLKAESISHVGISCTDVDQLDFFVAGIISFSCHCTLHLGIIIFIRTKLNATVNERFLSYILECDSPMGMENGNISDSALKAFSEVSAPT